MADGSTCYSKAMEILVTGITYGILAVAYWRGISAIVLVCGHSEPHYRPLAKSRVKKAKILLNAILDIILFRRLLRVNRALWIGEWVFHVSFALVLLGHLRYIMQPVPGIVMELNCIGKHAGYVLPLSLLYILIVRLVISEKGEYFSVRNLVLVSVIFILGATGVIMRYFVRPDVIDIKHYVLGVLAFDPNPLPLDPVFLLHYILFLVLLLFLPSHILAAPIVMIEARERDDTFVPLGHEE
ncbi:MAG: hypothetical protein JSV21_00650 [Nitrospirota bacterium]|nr:MAG: hypothetical protein JSV21_00650 [Nitrospirota bacterium]